MLEQEKMGENNEQDYGLGRCPVCGTPYRADVKAGSCYLCLNCGQTSGCS